MKIQENVSLKNYTTFRIGGPARYFIEARNNRQIIEAVTWARQNKLPFFILGSGSNLLVSDKGFQGLVIKAQNQKIKVTKSRSVFRTFLVEAGVPLSKLVNLSFKGGLTGLEWAAGIPGTVGGAVRGNAGAFGGDMGQSIKSVQAFDTLKMRDRNFKNKDCNFSYRKSFFKKNPHLVILSCEVILRKGDKGGIREKIGGYLSYRQQRHPKNPSAGSVFKNTRSEPAAVLIHLAGLTGKNFGKAQISKKHSNFIVNNGGAEAADVVKLIKFVKKSVKKKFRISLQEEIQLLGKF